MSLDIEADDLPGHHDVSPFESLITALRLFLPARQRRSELGFTSRLEDGEAATRKLEHEKTEHWKAQHRAAARRYAQRPDVKARRKAARKAAAK